MKRASLLLLCLLILFSLGCKGSPVEANVASPVSLTPTAVPTPTPNSEDALYTMQGEEVVYKKDGQEIDPYQKGSPMPDYWLYKSPNLRVEIKQVTDTVKVQTYFVADIRVRNGEREFPGFGSKKAPGNNRSKPYLLARLYGAVFAINGDYLINEEKELKGILIRDGVVYNEGKKEDTLAFYPDMSLRVFEPGQTTAKDLISQGVVNAISFGPTLVKDGAVVQNMKNVRNINNSLNPRSGIGMVAPGHLIAIVLEGRLPRSKGMNLADFAQLFVDQGCTLAYNLDGSASANMIFLGNSCNYSVNDGKTYLGPRPLVDMICFGKSSLCPAISGACYSTGQFKSSNYSTPTPGGGSATPTQ